MEIKQTDSWCGCGCDLNKNGCSWTAVNPGTEMEQNETGTLCYFLILWVTNSDLRLGVFKLRFLGFRTGYSMASGRQIRTKTKGIVRSVPGFSNHRKNIHQADHAKKKNAHQSKCSIKVKVPHAIHVNRSMPGRIDCCNDLHTFVSVY